MHQSCVRSVVALRRIVYKSYKQYACLAGQTLSASLGRILYSLDEDCRWHREWSQALTRMVIEDNSHNIGTIQGWIEKWHPVAARALQPFASLFEGKSEDAQMSPPEGVVQKLDKFYRDYLSAMGLQPTISGVLLS